MPEGTQGVQKIANRYTASNISTEKMLEGLSLMLERAHEDHARNAVMEQARYEQELKDIERFRDMFYCSNFEK